MSSMFCERIYSCKNSRWCARDFKPETYGCYEEKTRFDEIKEMSEEQFCDLFIKGSSLFCPVTNEDCINSDCRECFLKWLKSGVEDRDENNRE